MEMAVAPDREAKVRAPERDSTREEGATALQRFQCLCRDQIDPPTVATTTAR